MSGIKGKSGRKARAESEKGKPWSKPKGAKSKASKSAAISIRLSDKAVLAKCAMEESWNMSATGVIETLLTERVQGWDSGGKVYKSLEEAKKHGEPKAVIKKKAPLLGL